MALFANCPVHGIRLVQGLFGGPGAASLTFANSSTNCPVCGRIVPIVDGTYEVVGGAVQAFTASTRETVAQFRDIIESVQKGSITKSEADTQVEQLSSAISKIWQMANQNAGALSVLLAIITIYLTISAGWSADEAAAKLQAGVEEQTQVEQQILAELQKQNAPAPTLETARQPTQQMQGLSPQRTTVAAKPNRHERRKAKAKSRRP